MPKSPNMTSQCIGFFIDSKKDEKFAGKSKDAWFFRRQANTIAWSFNIFPPWDDNVVPALGDHGSVARANRVHMISSNEFYARSWALQWSTDTIQYQLGCQISGGTHAPIDYWTLYGQYSRILFHGCSKEVEK